MSLTTNVASYTAFVNGRRREENSNHIVIIDNFRVAAVSSYTSCSKEKHFNDKCTVECDRCWNAGQQADGHKSKEFTCTSKSADAPDGKFDPPATALVCERACYPPTTTKVSFLSPAVCTCSLVVTITAPCADGEFVATTYATNLPCTRLHTNLQHALAQNKYKS